MKYYRSDLHEKLVRTDASTDEAFAKPIEGGEEMALPKGSPILIDAITENNVITEDEYEGEIEDKD
jgi:hypothetical protein